MKDRNFNKDNILFMISVCVVILFLGSPILLRIRAINYLVTFVLSPLKEQGYKSSYIETVGGMLGTFLAVTGALWTQRRIDLNNERNAVKKAAVIVYYDFKFAFEDIFAFERSYACIKPGTKNQYDDRQYFIEYSRKIELYIDSNWIHNVAELCGALPDDDIKQIYKIYGDLETIKSAFEKDDEDIDTKLAHSIFVLIHRDICDLTLMPRIEVNHKVVNEKLMKKLEELATG